LNNQNTSRIVPAMKRTSLLLALLVASAFPAMAQSTEFGVLVGGSRRFVENNYQPAGGEGIDDTFSFSNTSVELYYKQPIDPATSLRLKVGRMDGSVAFQTGEKERTDTTGEIQHISGLVEYEFDEPYGSTSLFGGLGMYRQSAAGFDSETGYGLQIGLGGDFPLTRRYGLIAEASYHWIHFDVRPRYLTVSGGLRIAF
jgi:hypothetical protein